MGNNASDIPLYVDLDGTLIKSDLLLEGLFLLLRNNPLYLFIVLLWLLSGRSHLKSEVARRASINAALLPVNPEFLAFLQQEKAKGRRIVLISAANERAVATVADHFALFDEHYGSNDATNLKAETKLKRIQAHIGQKNFAYAGNSRADLPLWQAASEVIQVNCPPSLTATVEKIKPVRKFDRPGNELHLLWEALRPHQWIKNGLLFIPLILAQKVNNLHLLQHAIVAFVCFSLAASSVYLLNDLLDLNSDRHHPSKKQRPLASGRLSLYTGLFAMPVILLAALILAHTQTFDFVRMLGIYWLLTMFYSFVLKRVLLLDLVTLSSLYCLRLISGAAAVSVLVSPWLLAFSFSLFTGLAVVKRVTELINISSDSVFTLPGRAYTRKHLRMLTILGIICCLLAVLVLGIYINAEEAAALYSSPLVLWPICGLLFLVLFRLWNFAIDGRLQYDPILFAIRDRPSQIATALMFVLLWMAI